MVGGDGEATVIEQWGRVRGRLRSEVGEAAYRSWLKPLTLAGSRNGKLRLAVPTRFMRDWVASNYAERLHALWAEEDDSIGGIEIVVAESTAPWATATAHAFGRAQGKTPIVSFHFRPNSGCPCEFFSRDDVVFATRRSTSKPASLGLIPFRMSSTAAKLHIFCRFASPRPVLPHEPTSLSQ